MKLLYFPPYLSRLLIRMINGIFLSFFIIGSLSGENDRISSASGENFFSTETPIEIKKIEGCTGSTLYGASAVNNCTGQVCITMTITAEGMHGTENWNFDWGNGKTWDTTTKYSAKSVPCPSGSSCAAIGCGTMSSINGVCSCSGCDFTATITKCGIYTSPGTYTISMAVTPAHNTCLDSWVITIPPPTSITVNNATICPGQSATLTASGSTNYTWQPGNLTGPSITVSPTTTTTYTVRGSGACSSQTVPAVVTVNPRPTITASPQSITCGQTSATLTAGGGTSYTWSTGATGTSITVSPTVSTTYTVTGRNAQGCTNTQTVLVTVTGCGPTVVAPPATLCPGECASLTATASGGTTPYTYTWNPGGFVGNPLNACPPATTTYTVMVSDANGGTASTTAVVTINPVPTITSSPQTICSGDCTTLTAGGAGAGGTYTWTPAIGTGAGPHQVCPTATTTYTVFGANSFGCTNSTTVVVNVNPNPVLTATPASICAGDNATVTAGGATTYTWNTGAQTPGITVSPTVTTTYTVYGTTNGCTGSATVAVTVNNNISIAVPGATICAGDPPVTLTATAPNGTSFTWSTGATGPGITVSPSATTTYSVSGTSPSGCTGATTVQVVVNPIPVITASTATICNGVCTSLSASGGAAYTWSPSSGLGSTTGSTVQACPPVTSTYTIIGASAAGCISSTTTIINVNNAPVLTVNSANICLGATASLTASGATTYTWSTGAQTAGITVSPASTTSYTVSGTSAGCTGSAIATVTVNPIPTITASTADICSGNTATLTASGAAGYTWLPGGTTGSSLTGSPTATTTYTVIGSTAAGCTNSTLTSVTVHPIPIVNFEPDTAACVPLTVSFLNLSQANLGTSTCSWTFTGGVPSGSSQCLPGPVTYNTPGVYSVTLTVTSNGCSATLIRPNIIRVYPYPKALFTANPMVTDIMEPTITFTNLSTDDSSCVWDFGDGTSASVCGYEFKHTYEDTGTYQVCLNILNRYACPDEYCLTVIVKPLWSFYIPNAFSPNGDGMNETFRGKSWNVIEHEMWIFDRWGNMIYYTGKTKDPESAIPWDGRANGGADPAQEDVYVWLVKFKDIFGKQHKLVGHVTLVK